MKLKRLLRIFSIGLLIGYITPYHGAGILSSALRWSTTTGSYQFAVRHYSTKVLHGKYLKSPHQDTLSLVQYKYPKYSGVKGLILQPRILRVDTMGNYDVLCHVLAEDLDGPFRGLPIQPTEDMNTPPFVIAARTNSIDSPYSTLGKIEITFPAFQKQPSDVFFGTAAAIDRNLVVTAASNLLPSTIQGYPNHKHICAEQLKLKHMLKDDRDRPNPQIINSPIVTMHCFIHPEWVKSFAPGYDIALVFLSESLSSSEKELESSHTRERVTNPKQEITSQKIVYHLLDASEIGNNPIRCTLEDSMACKNENGAANASNIPDSLVKLRTDVLPFVDVSVNRHQVILEEFLTKNDMSTKNQPLKKAQFCQSEQVNCSQDKVSDDEIELREIRKGLLKLRQEAELEKGSPLTEREIARYNISHFVLAQKKQAAMEALIDEKIAIEFAQGVDKGMRATRIESAKKMLEDGMPLALIAKYSCLTEEEIYQLSQTFFE